MSKDDDLDWGDDFLDGDIDFNDDFESGSKKKGIVAGFTSGYLGGLVEYSVGSSEAITQNLKRILPSSYSTLFDRVEYYKLIKDQLFQEFREENYESVKTLQNIARKIGGKIDNENNVIKKKLTAFSEDDFSTWERVGEGKKEDPIEFADDTHADFDESVNRLIQNQNQAVATTVSGVNQMQAEIGGGIIAAVKTGNRGLLGIESGMRDLLNYQRNVQYKMDKTMLEITAKSYVLDARFYKFSEKANHRIIEELKKVAVNSAMSDYAKTTDAERLKGSAKNAIIKTIGQRTGGLLGQIRKQFSKDNRTDAYGNVNETLSLLDEMISEPGGGLGWGGLAEVIGGQLAEKTIKSIPGLFRQGPFRELGEDLFSLLGSNTRNSLKSGWGTVRDIGNMASYLSTNGGSMLNYYAKDWKRSPVDQFENYEAYVKHAKANNQKVIPKALYGIYTTITDRIKEAIDNTMSGIGAPDGTRYTLQRRNPTTLTTVAQWKEVNNIALVDVIPGWLSKIYESQERMRTGNDSFRSPVFSYTRGQFIDRTTAKSSVKTDIFTHSQFVAASSAANKIVDEIDDGEEKILTPKQREDLALAIAANADKEYGFNPFQYIGEIDGLDPKTQRIVNQLIKNKFGLTDQRLAEFEKAGSLSKIGQHLTGFRGEYGDRLNRIGTQANELTTIFPNIAEAIEASRNAGSEDLLRELGIIITKDGVDNIDNSFILQRLREYLRNPEDKKLIDTFDNVTARDAGLTRSYGKGKQTTINRNNLGGLESSVESLTETIKEQVSKLDFSSISFDLQGIPDKFDVLNQTNLDQKTLLEKISECVCRTAGGWGNKTRTEKDKIEREENEGKKSLLDKIKAFSPKNFFNRSIETLAANSPLVLTGLAAGLAGYAFKDPKAAALIAGGVGVGYLYSKLTTFANSKEPSDDENIYNEYGDVLLYASKLRNGDYWDATTKAVLKTWKDIKGAVYDAGTKTYVTLSQLSGKIFGPDNRRRFLSGLSKVKDFVKAVWNRIDISGTFGKVRDAARNAVYQQDVYAVGSDEPRLTRNGFKNKRYYCIDPSTKQPFVINGWNEIKGPVYELDESNMLTQIVSEGEIAQGLMTSSGMKLDALKERLNWVKEKASWGAGKLFGYAKEKAGIGIKKVSDLVSADYHTIETRLDRIYYLLCDEFGRPVQPLPSSGIDPNAPTGSDGGTKPEGPNPTEPLGGAFKAKVNDVKSPFEMQSDYPHKVRLNSFEDKEIKEEEAKRDAFYEDIHDIKENMEGMSGTDKNGKEKKKGIWGMLAGILGTGFGVFKKLFTNPLGLLGDVIGLTIKSILKSPLRLVKLGSLLFKGVLGVTSPIFKLLRGGFVNILAALTGGALNLVDGFLPGGAKRKRRRTAKQRLKRMKGGKPSRSRRGLWGGLALGALSAMPFFASANSDVGGEDDEDQVYDENGYAYDDDEEGYENDYYGYNDNTSGVADRVVDGLYTADQAAYLTGAGIAGAGKAAQTFAPGMSSVVAGTKAGGGVLKALGGVGKFATRMAGKAFWPLAALQAGMAFADSKEVGDIFGTNVIDGRQRASHAITDFLDMGGLVSGTAKMVGGLFGMDTSKLDGMATRAVNSLMDNKLVNWLTDIPILSNLIPGVNLVKVLKEYQTDLSSIQRKIRMAMYGIKDSKEKLAIQLESIERRLIPFMQVRDGHVTIRKDAPLAEIVQGLTKTNIPEAAVWMKCRFLPVYQLWVSVANILSYPNIDALDSDKSPTVIKAVNQVEAAVVQFNPPPYDIAPKISEDFPIMNREETEKRLKELNEEMRKEFKNMGVDEKGDIDTKTIIRTSDEIKEGKTSSTRPGDKLDAWTASKFTKLTLSGFEEPKAVVEIDISDLHPGDGKQMDELVMVRLGAYGNTDDNGIRVDAVLKLERYCEQFFALKGGTQLFEKDPKELLNLFKNSFQLVPAWYDHWLQWFTNRFLPVLKTWVRCVYNVKKKLPKESWTSLSASNRSEIAHALLDAKIEINREVVSIWSVEESPFIGTTSGTDANSVKKYVTSLDAKRTDKLLKDPTSEREASGKRKPLKPLTEDEKYALYHGGKKANYSRDVGASAYAKSKGNTTLDDLIKGNKSGGDTKAANSSTGNYNESIMPTVNSGAYGKVSSAGDKNYSPSGSSKGFKISEHDAKKVILNEFLKAGITDEYTLAFAIANAAIETSLGIGVENLNYSADKLRSMPAFQAIPGSADMYGYNKEHRANPEMIARIKYGTGKTARNLGNTSQEDGWKYIGRGFTQLTGRDNYTRAANDLGIDLVNHPELAGNDPRIGALTTLSYFKTRGVLKALENGDAKQAAVLINKYGYKAQNEKLGLMNKYLNEFKSGELKNIVEELNASDVVEDKTKAESQAEAVDGTTGETGALAQQPIGGLDGTNKVNVPPSDSTDANAPPITTPAVTADDAKPADKSGGSATAIAPGDTTTTDVSKQPQQNVAAAAPVAPPKPVEEKKSAKEEKKSQEPQLTPVYDGAVVSAINNLTKSLESVLSQSKRVSVSSRGG